MATLSTSIQTQGQALGSSLPALLVKAERLAATVMAGVHGRRRAGPGDNFWAYRDYSFGDPIQRIDWHKSAKGDRAFIRENEWEAANTLWLWLNLGARMKFKSHLAEETKLQHAQILSLAIANLALRSHERVGLLGINERASHGRHVLPKLALNLAQENAGALPFPSLSQRRSAGLFISDFLEEPEALRRSFAAFAETGMRGHLLQIADPAEETLPYEGRIEFEGLDLQKRFRSGKTQSLRAEYIAAYDAQREAVKQLAKSIGWTFTVHRTDKPLTQAVLTLYHLIGDR